MPGGRPLKFKTPEIMQELIDKYFKSKPRSEWTITGLALALDTDRITLINYEGKPEFINTIKKAKMMVEDSYEDDLKKSGRTGTIFALKNFGWADTQKLEHTGKDGGPIDFGISDMVGALKDE